MPTATIESEIDIMNEADLKLAQAQFAKRVGVSGYDTIGSREFITYVAIPFACSGRGSHAEEAMRLLVSYMHIRAGKTWIDQELVSVAKQNVDTFKKGNYSSIPEYKYTDFVGL
jgi:hypothetical protein